jgi:hypothetical protein
MLYMDQCDLIRLAFPVPHESLEDARNTTDLRCRLTDRWHGDVLRPEPLLHTISQLTITSE